MLFDLSINPLTRKGWMPLDYPTIETDGQDQLPVYYTA